MAFFNIGQPAKGSAPIQDDTQAPAAPAPVQNDSNTLSFTTQSNDTFAENHKNNVNLNQDVNVDVTADGLKSVTPKMDALPPLPEQPAQVAPVMPVNTSPLSQPLPDLSSNIQNDLSYANYTLDQILLEGVKEGASDVHFIVGYRAEIRVDGLLKTFKSSVLTPEIIEGYVKQLIQGRSHIKFDEIKEVDLTYALGDRRFRINIYKQMGVFSIACRVVPEKITNLEDLNLPTMLKEFTKFPNGLVLVTGPTGSGKSTTIASILNNINLTQPKHITSIEDPVEYVFPKAVSIIDQREFGLDFESWSMALRSVLRQDPDIVFVGEMRDFDSIEAALQIADTGHLVFATLHTNGAAQSIDRIIDVFPAEKQSQIRIQLSSVLRAVVSQRLVALPTKGRVPVAEILIANSAVKNAIRDNKVFLIDNIIQTSSDEGMVSMEKSLAELVKKGMISIETAKSLSLRPKEVDILIHQ